MMFYQKDKFAIQNHQSLEYAELQEFNQTQKELDDSSPDLESIKDP